MNAEKIVDEIIKDLCGRSGGDHFFESCDEEIQEEIRETWIEIVKSHDGPPAFLSEALNSGDGTYKP